MSRTGHTHTHTHACAHTSSPIIRALCVRGRSQPRGHKVIGCRISAAPAGAKSHPKAEASGGRWGCEIALICISRTHLAAGDLEPRFWASLHLVTLEFHILISITSNLSSHSKTHYVILFNIHL